MVFFFFPSIYIEKADGNYRISLRPTEVPFMWSFLLQGPNIDHPYIVEHPEALAPIFVEYTGRRRDIVFGDVVWLSHYRYVACTRKFPWISLPVDQVFGWSTDLGWDEFSLQEVRDNRLTKAN